MYGIVERLLVMAFYASVMIVVVIAVRAVIKNAPRQICCVLWALVAFRLICPFEIPCVFSVYNLAENTVVSENEMLNKTDDLDSAGQTGQYDFESAAGAKSAAEAAQRTPTAPSTASGSASAPTNPTTTAPAQPPLTTNAPRAQTALRAAIPHIELLYAAAIPHIAPLWAAGALAMFAWTAYGSRRLRKTVAASAPLKPHSLTYKNVYICDDIRAPFTAGIFKPKIYIPSGMEQASIRHVIAHECAHIKRGDNITKALGCALRAVYWFDPFVWLAYELFSRDVEIACDERVVKEMEREERAAYSQALLNCSISGGRRIMAYSAAFSGSSGIKERVNRVMNYKQPALWVSAAAIILCIAAAVCFMTAPANTPAGQRALEQEELSKIVKSANTSKFLTEEQVVAVLENNGFKLEKIKKPDALKGNGIIESSGTKKIESDKKPLYYRINYTNMQERVMLLYIHDSYKEAEKFSVQWYDGKEKMMTDAISGKNISVQLVRAYITSGEGKVSADEKLESGVIGQSPIYAKVREALCMDAFYGCKKIYTGESENWCGELEICSYSNSDGSYTYGKSGGVIKANYKSGYAEYSGVKGYSVPKANMSCDYTMADGAPVPDFAEYEDGYYITGVGGSTVSAFDEYNVDFEYTDGRIESLILSKCSTLYAYDDWKNSDTTVNIKIWNKEQIESAFIEKISESKPKDDITIIDCTAVTDNVYDTVGAVLYRLSSQPEVIETAFVKSDGFFQTCGTYTQICDEPELRYLGNGTVVFKAVKENGEIYGHILSFSQSEDGKNTHFKAAEQEIM